MLESWTLTFENKIKKFKSCEVAYSIGCKKQRRFSVFQIYLFIFQKTFQVNSSYGNYTTFSHNNFQNIVYKVYFLMKQNGE